MASSTRHLGRALRQVSRAGCFTLRPVQLTNRQRIQPFSYSVLHRNDGPRRPPAFDATNTDVLEENEYLTPATPFTVADLDPGSRADYELMSKADQTKYIKLENHFKAIFEGDEFKDRIASMAESTDREIEREHGSSIALDFPSARVGRGEVGFWADDEEDEFGQMEDGDDGVSDDYVSAVAESQLDLHRDIREYTRIAAWDLPLLQQYAKPFQPPNQSTPLRFRYTTYMGEYHPAARKVVVEFSTKDLLAHPSSQYKLSEAQRVKLIKLVGVRYNPSTDVVKMSSEKFETPAQNKRYLGELIGTLLKEAKDKRDEMKDIPFDFRHHKPKKEITYPEEWKMSSKTVKQLAQKREQLKLFTEDEVPVDGDKLVADLVRVGPKTARLLQ